MRTDYGLNMGWTFLACLMLNARKEMVGTWGLEPQTSTVSR